MAGVSISGVDESRWPVDERDESGEFALHIVRSLMSRRRFRQTFPKAACAQPASNRLAG
ncbi:protein of unknown function (plasmid) [Caballeronia sp. S22]